MTIIKGIIASIVVIVKGILLILEMIIKLPIWLIGEIASDIRLKKKKKKPQLTAEKSIFGNRPSVARENLNHHKDAFVKALIDDGMLALAEEWVSCIEEEAEDSTEERRGYMVDDETAVYLPISEADFAASLGFNDIDISYDEKADDISACIYIDCDPDYFAGHSIEIYMDSKGNVDVVGLAG